jgi:hypothetical protein
LEYQTGVPVARKGDIITCDSLIADVPRIALAAPGMVEAPSDE